MATSVVAAAATAAAQTTLNQSRNKMGVVVAAGVMNRTAKVRIAKAVWNRRIQRTLIQHTDHFVHDPSNTARPGDIVAIESGFRVSREKRHRLSAIISPKGPPMSERPPIPSKAELLLEYKKDRVKTDIKLLAHADAVIRLHELSANANLVQEVSQGGDEAGVMSSEAQELRDLQSRPEAKEAIPRSINGVMMRLRETLKARWREARETMTYNSADVVAEEMQSEGQRWFVRGTYWLTQGAKPMNRGRSKQWRQEMSWRGDFALDISRALRLRAVEALAYKKRIDVFARATGRSRQETAPVMAQAEIDIVRSMARYLRQKRGVYDAEIHALKEEHSWLKTVAHLQKEAWRWEAHEVQLKERGALDSLQIVNELKARGTRSPVWYRAMREALAYQPKADVIQYVGPLRDGLDARKDMMDAAEENERRIAAAKKQMLEEAKNSNAFIRTMEELAALTSQDRQESAEKILDPVKEEAKPVPSTSDIPASI